MNEEELKNRTKRFALRVMKLAAALPDDPVGRAIAGRVEGALCPHPGGPPTCWCRPPLPGLPLVFARAHDLDPARSTLIGIGPAHRNLAAALGARYVSA